MNIFVDDEKAKTAARTLYDLDQDYSEGDEKPSLSVYEAAVTTFLENAAASVLAEPEYYAFGPRMIFWGEWERALSHAQHWHNHPLAPNRSS